MCSLGWPDGGAISESRREVFGGRERPASDRFLPGSVCNARGSDGEDAEGYPHCAWACFHPYLEKHAVNAIPTDQDKAKDCQSYPHPNALGPRLLSLEAILIELQKMFEDMRSVHWGEQAPGDDSTVLPTASETHPVVVGPHLRAGYCRPAWDDEVAD